MNQAADFRQHVLNGNLREVRTPIGRSIATVICCTRCTVTWERESGDGRAVMVADRANAVRHVTQSHPEVLS